MEVNELTTLITSLGLPTVAVYFLWNKMTNDTKSYIELLRQGIDDNKKANEKLLEVNAQFAQEIVKINVRIDSLDEKVDNIIEKIEN